MSHSPHFVYLLLFPYPAKKAPGLPAAVKTPKDAPYFYELDMEVSETPHDSLEIAGVEVKIRQQVLDETVIVFQCDYSQGEKLNGDPASLRHQINSELRSRLLTEYGYKGDMVEEYTIICVEGEKSPEKYVTSHEFLLARLLRATDKPITKEQAQMILKSRARYSSSDLTIVDWEGALVLAENGDFQSDIELLKIGNYQLLRYRLLDEEIENDLGKLRSTLRKKGVRWLPGRQTLLTIIQNRLQLLLDFEWTDQALLLIGDWYSAQLYRIIVDEFYVDDWKNTVRSKLDILSDAEASVRQNLSFSWDRLLDFVQIAGWLILLVGYFFLFVVDFTRK